MSSFTGSVYALRRRAGVVRRLGLLLALVTLLSGLATSAAWASSPAPQPGSYAGDDSEGYGVSFYVSANGEQIQDVSVGDVGMSCSNGSNEIDANFNIATAAITSGAFSSSSAASGVIAGKPETTTYTFAGQFDGSSAAGQLSEVIKYKTGTVTCSSNNLSWTATPSAQGSQTAAAPLPGSYTGDDSEGYGLSFYVAANRKQVQDVSVGDVGMSCSNGSNEIDANFSAPTAAVKSGSTFTAKSAQSGEVGGKPAAITYKFTGHFHGLNTAGNQRAAGQLSEVIKYKTGTTVTCTSDTLGWTATQSAQGSQTAAAPLPGSYAGDDSEGYGVSFYVSANGEQVQDVSVGDVGMSCSNGSNEIDANFSLATAAVKSGTTFTGTSTQSGEVGGKPATITYTFAGHFHGLNTAGNQRAAGQLKEVIKYPSGTIVTCTSNNLSWTATLGAQGSQTAAPPLPGSYTGDDSEGYGLSFQVSADSEQVQNISVGDVGMSCSNGSNQIDAHFSIPSATITSGTSFTGSSVVTDPTETITYTFTGHFHGLNTSGNQRAAGQLSEVIQTTTGTSVTCTSNNLNWTATS
jgi:hypothetical protein